MQHPDPTAFSIFGLDVKWYGVLIALALIVGLFICLRRAPAKGIANDDILDFFIVLIPSIVVGARLYYVIFEWEYYAAHPDLIFKTWTGGLAIHGGIIAGIIAALVLCKVKKISFFALADTVIPALPLGQAIGRWGNFINGEAYGSPTDLPWAITVYDPLLGMVKVHPTFLYESIWNLLVCGGLLLYEKKWQKAEGELIFLYFILYSAGRFFIEGLRTDSLMFFGLKTAQLISLALIAIGCGGIIWLRRRGKSQA